MDVLDHLVWGLGIAVIICTIYNLINNSFGMPEVIAISLMLFFWMIAIIFKMKESQSGGNK